MKLRLTLALLLPALAGSAQTLTNDGATITVESGAILYVAGAVQNNAASTLANAGTLQVTGNLTNAGTLTSPGLLLFSGAANQVFTPGTATVAGLTVNNTGAVGANMLSIPADLTVTGALTLTNGMVRTAPIGLNTPLATLTLPDGVSVTGEDVGRYVQGNLRVVRATVTTPKNFTNGAELDPAGQDLGTVTITRTAGLVVAGLSFGQNMAGTNKGIDRVWTVVSSQSAQPTTGTPATLILKWVSDDDNGFNPAAMARLWRGTTAAGPWAPQGTPASVAVAGAARSFTTSVARLGAFTVSNLTAPLPVELTRFTAEAQGEDAQLRWATASEKNNDHFDVEASANGREFQRIGVVASQGNSTQTREYALLDKNIARYATELVYYRLRQVDTDGTATFSPVRTVKVSSPVDFAVQLYPNPAHGGEATALLVRTAEAGPVTWQLTDALGRTLSGQVVTLDKGASTLPLPAAALATGVYLVRVQQGRHHQVLKLVRE